MTAMRLIQSSESPRPAAHLEEVLARAVANWDLGKANPAFRQPDFVVMKDGSPLCVVEAKSSPAGAAWRAQNSLDAWYSQLTDLRDHALDPTDELTLLLLRTAEEHSGVPRITSGLIVGLERERGTDALQLWNLHERRIEAAREILYSASGSGKTMAMLIQLMGRAKRGRIQPVPSPGVSGRCSVPTVTVSLLTGLVDDVEVLREFLRVLTRGLMGCGIQPVRPLVALPPRESSPCGVLRLAAPIVPGAPGTQSWPHQRIMTLAA
ncbi:hypothetical protein ACGF3G_44990 [Streptomyces sp. NPDC048179]|uniref:hypothetical protein n=1 Tax=Streptomyces sp. NPDC048179 TaxID=3365506 RepID=UPI00371C6A31